MTPSTNPAISLLILFNTFPCHIFVMYFSPVILIHLYEPFIIKTCWYLFEAFPSSRGEKSKDLKNEGAFTPPPCDSNPGAFPPIVTFVYDGANSPLISGTVKQTLLTTWKLGSCSAINLTLAEVAGGVNVIRHNYRKRIKQQCIVGWIYTFPTNWGSICGNFHVQMRDVWCGAIRSWKHSSKYGCTSI